MPQKPRCNCNHAQALPTPALVQQSIASPKPTPTHNMGDPPIHRWPHPIQTNAPHRPNEDAAAHHLHCALAYQNQMLADIKSLLQQLVQQNNTCNSPLR